MTRSNGRIERVFRELNTKYKLLKTHIKHWSVYLPFVLYMLNNTPRSTLQMLTPMECMYGRSMHMPYKYIRTESLNHHDFLKALNGFINEFHKDLMISHYAGHEKLV